MSWEKQKRGELDTLLELYDSLVDACDDLIATAKSDGLARTADEVGTIEVVLDQIRDEKLNL